MQHFYQDEAENPFPPLTIISLLLILVVILGVAGSAVMYLFNLSMGLPFDELLERLAENNQPAYRNQVRWSVMINHLFSFVLPAIILAFVLFRQQWKSFLSIHRWPTLSNALLGSLFLLAALPLAQITFWLNKQIPLPQWAQSMENATADLVNNLLVSDSPYEVFFNLLVVALIPAIGEELVFRGILQKNLHRLINNPHLAIWLTGFIFSAIHLQFEGFLPRMVLGAMLGYLFWWTQNLWVPIIAHFANNGIQVFAQYLHQEKLSSYNPEQIGEIPWVLSVFSTIFVAIIGYYIYQNNQANSAQKSL